MKRFLFLFLLPISAFAQINDLLSKPAATSPAVGDYLYLQGATNKTRKLAAQYYEPALGVPGVNDYVLSSKTDGTRSWVPMTGGGGGGGTWGSITGTLSAQSDLNTALGLKLAAASNLSDLANAVTARTNLGLGSLATQNGTFSGASSGTNTGDQDLSGLVPKTYTVNGHALSGNVSVTTTDLSLNNVTNDAQTKAAIVPNTAPTAGQILVGNAGGTAYAAVSASGDVTIASTGAHTIASNAVTNAKAAQMAAHTFKGNNTGSTANASDLTATQLTAELNAVVGDSGSGGTKGLVPAPAAGDAAAGKYLKADGGYSVPPGTGGVTFANPSATAGLTAVNGSASTAMRSDAAPAISQGIAPTWTGQHRFNLIPELQWTSIAAGASQAAVINTQYYCTAFTSSIIISGYTGSPANGTKVAYLLIGCNGSATFTFPTAQRSGDPTGTSTVITPSAGTHQIVFTYVNSLWYYSDDNVLNSVANGATGVTTLSGIVKGNGTSPFSAAAAGTDYVAPSAYASANGLTMATARLLGRTTASTGAAEEITVGSGLSLSGGTLTATGSGTGDFSSNTSTSVDSEFVLFSSTTGKLGKRATGSGLARASSGVASFAELSGDVTTSGSNAVTVTKINGTSLAGLATGLLKNTTTTGVPSTAVAGTDYVAPSAYASANGHTMATNKLLGRTTASTGAAEEIAVGSGLSLASGTLSASGVPAPTVNAQTGTTYTLAAGDANNYVTLSNASPITLTVPLNASVAYTDGTTIPIWNKGAGLVTIHPASGSVTINGVSSDTTIAAQYLWATLVKIGTGTDTWALSYAAPTSLTAPVITGGLTASGSADNDFSGSTGATKLSSGGLVSGSGLAQHFYNNYSTTSQAPSASTRTYITGSGLSFPAGSLKVGTILRWRLSVTKTAAGTATSTYDIAFGTAGTTSDTARVSFTKPAGTAVADEGVIEIECVIRTNSASGVAAGSFRMTHNLSSTGHLAIAGAAVKTVSGTFDTTTVTNVGICVTSGASDALTFEVVTADSKNL